MGVGSFGLHAKHLPWGALGSLAIEKSMKENGFDGIMLTCERSLTSHRVNLFSPVVDADAYLGDSVVYVHLYKSQLTMDLAKPISGSVYSRLWELDRAAHSLS